MSYDHFRPPEHFSPTGRVLFRALCWITLIVGMALFSYFVVPLIGQYISRPFADAVTNFVFGPMDVAGQR